MRRRLDPVAFFYLIGYFQDILCKQANECDVLKQYSVLNRKMIGKLSQMASTQLNDIYTHKVKYT